MPSPIPIIPGSVLTAALVPYYGVPTQDPKVRQVELSVVRFINADATARTVTLHIVPAGGTAVAANARFKTLSIPPAADGTPPPLFRMGDVLLPGDTVHAMADAPGVVSISASGFSYP